VTKKSKQQPVQIFFRRKQPQAKKPELQKTKKKPRSNHMFNKDEAGMDIISSF